MNKEWIELRLRDEGWIKLSIMTFFQRPVMLLTGNEIDCRKVVFIRKWLFSPI